jgi:hypothetical protein
MSHRLQTISLRKVSHGPCCQASSRSLPDPSRRFAAGGCDSSAATACGWGSPHGARVLLEGRHADAYAAMISPVARWRRFYLPIFSSEGRLSGRALLRLARIRLLSAPRPSVAPKSPALTELAGQCRSGLRGARPSQPMPLILSGGKTVSVGVA